VRAWMKIFQSMVGKDKEKENKKKKIESSWYNLPLAHILKESNKLVRVMWRSTEDYRGHQHMHK
jgi:hypothetical protein